MKKPVPSPDWPQSWQKAYRFDCREFFGDRSAPHYTMMHNTRFHTVMEMIGRHTAPGARVLDLAAAQGNFTLALAEKGYDVTWNDIREELSGYVKTKHEGGQVRYQPGNLVDLKFDRCFDCVLMLEVIEHAAHPDQLLARVSDFVKPSGIIVLSTPNGGYLFNNLPKFSECADPEKYEQVQYKPDGDGHIFLLHYDEISSFARQAGLDIVESRMFTNPLTCGNVKLRYLHKVLPQRLIMLAETATRNQPPIINRRINSAMAFVLRPSRTGSGNVRTRLRESMPLEEAK